MLVPPGPWRRSGRTAIRLGRHREQDGVARSAATLADAFSRRVGVTAHGHSPVLLSTPAHRAVNPLLFPWTVPAKPGGRPIMLAPGLRPGPGTERSTRWRWSKSFVHGPIRATPHGYAGVGTAGPSDMRHASKGRCRIPAGCGGLHPNPQRGGSPFRAGPLTSHTGRAWGRKPSENGDGAGGRGFGDPANDGRAYDFSTEYGRERGSPASPIFRAEASEWRWSGTEAPNRRGQACERTYLYERPDLACRMSPCDF